MNQDNQRSQLIIALNHHDILNLPRIMRYVDSAPHQQSYMCEWGTDEPFDFFWNPLARYLESMGKQCSICDERGLRTETIQARANNDYQTDMSSCRQREAIMLDAIIEQNPDVVVIGHWHAYYLHHFLPYSRLNTSLITKDSGELYTSEEFKELEKLIISEKLGEHVRPQLVYDDNNLM